MATLLVPPSAGRTMEPEVSPDTRTGPETLPAPDRARTGGRRTVSVQNFWSWVSAHFWVPVLLGSAMLIVAVLRGRTLAVALAQSDGLLRLNTGLLTCTVLYGLVCLGLMGLTLVASFRGIDRGEPASRSFLMVTGTLIMASASQFLLAFAALLVGIAFSTYALLATGLMLVLLGAIGVACKPVTVWCLADPAFLPDPNARFVDRLTDARYQLAAMADDCAAVAQLLRDQAAVADLHRQHALMPVS